MKRTSDRHTRNNSDCPYCLDNRRYKHLKRIESVESQMTDCDLYDEWDDVDDFLWSYVYDDDLGDDDLIAYSYLLPTTYHR
jgi:hypothetical protein